MGPGLLCFSQVSLLSGEGTPILGLGEVPQSPYERTLYRPIRSQGCLTCRRWALECGVRSPVMSGRLSTVAVTSLASYRIPSAGTSSLL